MVLQDMHFTRSVSPQRHRGSALGVYNWGVYIGYSLAFAFNFILLAIGWRWTFWISALPGFVLGVIVIATVKEPQRRTEVRLVHLLCLLLNIPLFIYECY